MSGWGNLEPGNFTHIIPLPWYMYYLFFKISLILQSWQLMTVLVISTFSKIGQQALFYQETMPTATLTL